MTTAATSSTPTVRLWLLRQLFCRTDAQVTRFVFSRTVRVNGTRTANPERPLLPGDRVEVTDPQR